MKKALCLFIVIILTFVFISCSGGIKEEATKTPETVSTEETTEAISTESTADSEQPYTTGFPDTTGFTKKPVNFSMKADGVEVDVYNELGHENLNLPGGVGGFAADGPAFFYPNLLRIRDKLNVVTLKEGLEISAYNKNVPLVRVYSWSTGDEINGYFYEYKAEGLASQLDAGRYIVRVDTGYSTQVYSIFEAWYIGIIIE